MIFKYSNVSYDGEIITECAIVLSAVTAYDIIRDKEKFVEMKVILGNYICIIKSEEDAKRFDYSMEMFHQQVIQGPVYER